MAFERTRETVLSAYNSATGYVVSAGHAIHDLFINVLSDLMSPIDDRLSEIETALTLNSSMTHDQAKAFADRLGINTVTDSGKAIVNLVLTLSSSEDDVSISAGQAFTTESGLRFLAMESYLFDASLMTYDGRYYITPTFRVEAENVGAIYNVSAGQIDKSETTITNLVFVTNPEPAYVLGSDGSSAAEIVQLIQDSISNRSLATAQGAMFLLRQTYQGVIQSILPIRKGDPEMTRDRIYDASQENITSYSPRDFKGKKTGDTNVVASVLMKGTVDGIGSGAPAIVFQGGLPVSLDAIPLVEATQENYQEIYADDLSSEFTHQPGLLFEEDMANSAAFTEQFFGGKNGSTVLSNQLGVAASLYNNTLVIGDNDADGVADGDLSASYVSRQGMTRNTGVILRGTFKTNDDGLSSRPLYVTNFKRRSVSGGMTNLAIDGYGMAIKVNKNSSGERISGPNLFIVDGSSADQDMEILGDRIIGNLGVESFVAATEMDIDVLAGTTYTYELHYDGEEVDRDGETVTVVTLNIYVWAGTDDSARPSAPTLTYGSYVPINLRTSVWTSDGGTYDFDGVGMGILSTDNFLWELGPMTVIKVDNTYPALLAGFDVEGMLDGSSMFEFTGIGSGFNDDVQQYGLSVKLLSDPDGTPTWVGPYDFSNVLGTMQNVNVNFKLADYKSATNYVWVLITSKYPAYFDVSRQFSAYVSMRYTRIYPERPFTSSGEKMDLYVTLTPDTDYSPETTGSVILDSPRSQYVMNSINGFNLPILRITSVDVVDENGDDVGIQLVLGDDYHLVSVDDSLAGSAKDERVLYLMPSATLYGRLKVSYTYAANISAMQELLDLDDRSGVSDIVVFHRSPKYIDVTMSLNYVPVTLESVIREYIYNAAVRVEAFDMVALASNLGVDYGSVSDILIEASQFKPSGEVETESSGNVISKERSEIFIPRSINLKTI